MTPIHSWAVSGPYFEACSCEAVCPCRSIGGRRGGRSTYGTCEFALGWTIATGHADDLDLSGLSVVMAGWYDDDEAGSPWRVTLYIDDQADARRQAALEDIFLGRAGGTTLANFAGAIGEVHAVRPARVAIEHSADRRSISAGGWVEVSEREPVHSVEPITCAIPGHDHPGEEIVAERMIVDDDPAALRVPRTLWVRDDLRVPERELADSPERPSKE